MSQVTIFQIVFFLVWFEKCLISLIIIVWWIWIILFPFFFQRYETSFWYDRRHVIRRKKKSCACCCTLIWVPLIRSWSTEKTNGWTNDYSKGIPLVNKKHSESSGAYYLTWWFSFFHRLIKNLKWKWKVTTFFPLKLFSNLNISFFNFLNSNLNTHYN